jgi:hypothetical protein
MRPAKYTARRVAAEIPNAQTLDSNYALDRVIRLVSRDLPEENTDVVLLREIQTAD